ncbi:sigma-70 family RNA polymerase sigma factor [Algoriphagus confluentis]|uniref:Sigma-70 family RNA polymerase sigma factor n=1 Tax=Algoriphagus confluentis TaxID=1697556 RepID=A0ABQ6PMW5_9BACT|nr:sigma-70 family RNA polymerase sigma factor [Algoriphagus confluentis]
MFLSSKSEKTEFLGSPTSKEDERLWANFLNGNELAFCAIYNKYVNALFNYGMHLYPDREANKELIQELFSFLWQNRSSLKEVHQVNGYLFICYRNLVFRRIKEKDNWGPLDLIPNGNELAEVSTEEVWIGMETRKANADRIKNAIEGLPPRQREVVILKFFNGLNNDQLADILGISKEGIYNLMSKAIGKLRLLVKN